MAPHVAEPPGFLVIGTISDVTGATLARQMRELVDAAREGDERAFTLLVERYRPELHQHCYRMLGSLHDADDVVQESLLRAWSAIGRTDRGLSVRPWLYKIATNRCLTALASRQRCDVPTDTSPGAMAAHEWLEPYPGPWRGADTLALDTRVVTRERLELAFVVTLQQMSALQRATLLLREVLGFSAQEVAQQLNTTVPAVNSALQRARSVLSKRAPTRSQQHELAALGSEVNAIAARYVAAWEASDVNGLVAMLTDEVRLAMPEWYEGLEAVVEVLAAGPLTHRWRLRPTWASGQLTFGCYRWHDNRARFVGEGLDVVTLSEGKIAAIDAFRIADLTLYGLPPQITR